MAEELLINVTPREIRIALVEDQQLQEIYIERSFRQSLIGNIYKGRVKRLLPGLKAAFIDIGLERPAFLHVRDVSSDSSKPIQQLLHPGQDVLVQVYKDPLGTKGARLTMQFTLPMRHLVFMPGGSGIHVSQRIRDEAERQRLMQLIKPDAEGGYLFRTAAAGSIQADVQTEQEALKKAWAVICSNAQQAKAGDQVYQEIPAVLRILRDVVNKNAVRIQVDNAEIAQQMQTFASECLPVLAERITFYDDLRPLFDLYGIEDQLQEALNRKVMLKSGGHIIFDQTEAMTTVDVNTGSYHSSRSQEQTVLQTNSEAAEMIARQIRLRNLGGIIIVDFIDMDNPTHRSAFIKLLSDALAKDNARIEISELSSLGLLQMTRKRTRESLERILCVTCPHCQRRGTIKSTATVAYEIFRELSRTAQLHTWKGLLVLASKGVVEYMLNQESAILAAVEAKLQKPVKLKIEPSYEQEHYDVLPLLEKE